MGRRVEDVSRTGAEIGSPAPAWAPYSARNMNQTSSTGPADVRASKFLALVLRHDPGKIGIELDSAGWVPIDTLLAALKRHGRGLSRERLDQLVAENDKKRYQYDESRTRIRASQGHSLAVDLGYAPAEPPDLLYHGTATRFLDSIHREGLQRGKRHHVHLSRDVETARKVGARHGKPVVLSVDAARMSADGHVFLLSDNGVWLTEHVAPGYLAHCVGTGG